MQVLDLLAHTGTVVAYTGGLVIDGNRVPLIDATAVLAGGTSTWRGDAYAACARFGIPVLHCDWRGQPHALTYPFSSHSRVAARQRAQLTLTLPQQKQAWSAIVQAKITGQANTLTARDRDPGTIDALRRYANTVRSGDTTNREAAAAAAYWPELFEDDWFIRTGLGGTGRNALLNYAYAILRGTVLQAICAAGLWPGIGIFHRSRSNPFPLADDLIEPFRPAADHMVSSLPEDADLADRAIKHALSAVLTTPFQHGQGRTVHTASTTTVAAFATYCDDPHTGTFTAPAWQP